ncbi:MAG TPA: GNAT family N-acetyltransferase [Streptosporangiaceae bacterium]|nr:GNAT family N-acetyltransferase [Streptosporangiaceae bacterium]
MTTGSELIIRPIRGQDELGLFCQFSYVQNGELAADLAAGHRRPGWLWLALRGDHLLGRAGWWARSGQPVPDLLDVFDLDDGPGHPGRVDTGARLLRAAAADIMPPGRLWPEYLRIVPPDWQEQQESRQAVADRMAAVAQAGGRFLVERLRLEWLPGTPIADRTGRLEFGPASDVGELIGLMTAVLDGSLDAHSRHDLAQMPPVQVATRHYWDELARYQSPREWWRVARLPGGEPVGFVIPAHNGYQPVIAYLGVLPGHRGRGYIDEILAEGTRILAGEGAGRIQANTDLGNVPMAKAFRRAGWADTGHVINMIWD